MEPNVMTFLSARGHTVIIINEFNSNQLIFMELDADGKCSHYNSFGTKPDAKCTAGTNGSLYEWLGWK